jgi:hypothetical protein
MRFFDFGFLIEQLLLVPLDMFRKDFQFCNIFKELFVFVSLVYLESRLTGVFTSAES